MTEELLETPASPGPFFRFADEAAWLDAARAAGLMTTVTDEEDSATEQLQAYTHEHAIDVVGVITEGGEWDQDGTEIVATTTLDGFPHQLRRRPCLMDWETLEVTPDNPYRVFAQQPTTEYSLWKTLMMIDKHK